MKTVEIDQALERKFNEEQARLVFWHDEDSEFGSYLLSGLSGSLSSVQVINANQKGGLATKLFLEREDTEGQYLVYSTGPAPAPEHDWLLDIRLYSENFYADIASIWLQDLALSSLSLRDHLKARAPFFASQDRRQKLKRLVRASDSAVELDLKMLTVLSGAELVAPFSVFFAVSQSHVQDGEYRLDTEPALIEQFTKMKLDEAFWRLVCEEFTYEDDQPKVSALMRRLLVSELSHHLEQAPTSFSQFRLDQQGERNAVVFLTQWRDSSTYAPSFDAISRAISEELKISDHIREYDLSQLLRISTFECVEKRILSLLKLEILSSSESGHFKDLTELHNECSARQKSYWLSGATAQTDERQALHSAYQAILSAHQLLLDQYHLSHAEHQKRLDFERADLLLEAYQNELYLFDQHYRTFAINAQPSIDLGWDLLKSLAEKVEQAYSHGFLEPLGLEWSRHLDEGFLNRWSTGHFKAQQNFYKDHIEKHLKQSARKRAFVIISDAFRYEAARELVQELNGKFRMNAQISALLGVLPSYTTLGMASLLPHKNLTFNERGNVLVDGQSSSGTEARNRILSAVDGMACQASGLKGLKTSEAREFCAGKRVVYIYHNVIDARGDQAATESETFEAVRDCIQELGELVMFCTNKLNAAKVWITADHGFLYSQTAPTDGNRSTLSHRPADALKSKKRYVIGSNLGTVPEAHLGDTQVTAGTEHSMQFWVPRGANRFHFTGGARFVHGGAMPQEVLIPLITVKQLRSDKEVGDSRIEKVSVQVLRSLHKITTPKYRFEFIQTDVVTERRKPLTIKVGVYEGAEAVTSIEIITFDSDSGNIEERKKSVILELRKGSFDKATPYKLILRDVETEVEVQSLPVVIDRSFDDDF